MKRIGELCIVGLLLLVLASCSTMLGRNDDPFAQTKEVAREIGNSLVTGQGDVSALSIAIMHQGQIIHSEGFGMRDVAMGLPVEPDTRFNIGSISKVFTAAAILLLQEEGLLNLDDKVTDLMGDFTMADPRCVDITVRMLLNHSSGMPGTDMRGAFTGESESEYLRQSLEEFAKSSLKHDPGAFSPYCNDGFTVAQALVEHLSGISFTEFLQERIFRPLGMLDSSVGFGPEDENMAHGYIGRTVPLPTEYVHLIASGGITSSAQDLCRFASILFDRSLLGESSVMEFLSEHKPAYMQESPYDRLLSFGLGWDFTSWEPYRSQGIKVLGKTGGTLEYTTMLFVIPQSQSAVVLLSAGHIDPVGTTLPILDALLEESGLIPAGHATEETESPPTKPLPSGIDACSGYYGSASGLFRISFDHDDAVMRLETHDGSTFSETSALRHIGEGVFEKVPLESWFVCKTLLGIPFVMELRPHNQAEPAMKRIDPTAGRSHGFTAGPWLPTNIPPLDLYVAPFRITFVEELPSILMLDSVAYAITDERQTSMVLPTVRDQMPPRLDTEGRLIVGSYVCVDATDVPPLVSGQPIIPNAVETTVWRRINEHGTFSCTIPEGGRIVVLGPDFSDLEDTFYSGSERLEMDIFGSYVAFMAPEGTVFEPIMLPVR